MSPRPLVFLLGLSVGDYLLWHWSLNANHDVLALLSGLTLPPLAVACLWLLVLSLLRLLARTARRRGTAHAPADRAARPPASQPGADAAPGEQTATGEASRAARRIAA